MEGQQLDNPFRMAIHVVTAEETQGGYPSISVVVLLCVRKSRGSTARALEHAPVIYLYLTYKTKDQGD